MKRSASGALNSAIGEAAAASAPPSQKPPATPSRASLRGDEDFTLASVGVQSAVHRNLSPAELYEWALKEKGTKIAASGALSVRSGSKTGRSPKDKRIVDDARNSGNVWWGTVNIKMDEEGFLVNRERAIDFLNSVEQVFVFDGYAGWHSDHQIKIRVISSRAYHALFMHNMLIRPTADQLADFGTPDYVIYNAGVFPCNRLSKGMTSATSVSLHLARREFVILGTQYAGEMKKGVFTIMNYIMPLRGVLSLHSSCNVGPSGDVTVFFGLSGTGKTTLSADPSRFLIGDDEHCWCDDGVFNVEGGCYAKCIGLSREKEPFLWDAIRFGTVVENVELDESSREFDFESDALTENTRAAYPIEYISNSRVPCTTGHPSSIIMLACDAFGVLPPVSRLTDAQAMYHFISGYTARVAGTEVGVKEPQAVFSACFGAPFMVWHPSKYAEMLAQKMREHGCTAWLINTGWTGGAYGHGSRIKLSYTRSIIDCINNGSLLAETFVKCPRFGFDIPVHCAGVPDALLQPWLTWSDRAAYDTQLLRLTEMFNVNFSQFADKCTEAIRAAGPTLDGDMTKEQFDALFQKMSLSGGFG